MARKSWIAKESLARRVFRVLEEGAPRGGIAEKYQLVDDTGARWLFKPNGVHEAYVEEAAFRIAGLLGVRTPENYLARVGDVTGSLCRIIENRGDLEKVDPAQLSENQVAEVAEFQVFDWLIANFDTHGRNFLIAPDGHIVSIDHAYAFLDRYMFRYDLSSGRANKFSSYFTKFWDAVRAGEVRVDYPRLARFLDRAVGLPDAAFEAVLAPLARYRKKARGHVMASLLGEIIYKGEAEFLFAVMFRRRALRQDFARFVEHLCDDDASAPRCSLPATVHPVRIEGKLDPALTAFDPGPVVLSLEHAAGVFSGWRRAANHLAHRVVGSFEAGLPGVVHTAGRLAAWGLARGTAVADRVRGGLSAGQAARMRFRDLKDGFPLRDQLERTRPIVLRLLWERAHYVAANAPDEATRANAERMIAILRERPDTSSFPRIALDVIEA